MYAVGHAENAPGAHPFERLLAIADGLRLAPRMLTDTAIIVYETGTAEAGKPRSWAWTACRGRQELWGYLLSASRRSRGRPRSGW